MTGSRMRTPAALALLFLLGLAARADAAFVPALGSPFPTTAPARALALADADRNGTVDLASGTLALRRGDGTGRLGAATAVATTGPLDGIVAEDFNGDGRLDFAAIEEGDPDRLLLYEALPAGGWTGGAIDADVGEATRIAAADLDRDSRLDLVVAREDSGGVLALLFKNPLSGAFERVDVPSGIGPVRSLAVADLTGGGPPDVAIGSTGGEVELLVNDGTGGLTAQAPMTIGGPVAALAAGDFDGDGRSDIAASAGAAVALLRSDGEGTLESLGPPRSTGLPAAVAALAVADVNADGRADVAAGGEMGASVAVLLGDGSGALVPTGGSPFATGAAIAGAVGAVSLADVNRDSQPDVVAANETGSVSVLLNANTGLMEPTPVSVGFGGLPAAAPTRAHTVRLRSVRGRLRISRVAIEAGSRAFSVGPGTCVGGVLLVGESCAVTVRFKAPRRAESLEAVLSVDANAAAVIVPLTAVVRAPVVSGLRLRPRLLRPRLARRGRAVRGTSARLRYRLSERARVRVRVERLLPGRRARDGSCVPLRSTQRPRRRCRHWELTRTVARVGVPGANALRVRVGATRRPLPDGRYRLSVSAVDRFRNRSRERRIPFRVKARRPAGAGAESPAQAARPK